MDHLEIKRVERELAIGAFMADLQQLLDNHGVRFHAESDFEGGDYVYLYKDDEQISSIIDFAELRADAYVYIPPPPRDPNEQRMPFCVHLDQIQAQLKEDYVAKINEQLYGDSVISKVFEGGGRL